MRNVEIFKLWNRSSGAGNPPTQAAFCMWVHRQGVCVLLFIVTHWKKRNFKWLINSSFLWPMILCCLVWRYQYFGGVCCLHLHAYSRRADCVERQDTVGGKGRIVDCSVSSNRNADILQCSEWNWDPWNHFLHNWGKYINYTVATAIT